MKKLFAILMSIMMIACFMPTMAFADNSSNATVTVNASKITGKKGEAITDQTVTITLTDKTFADTLTGTDGWITNLPTGLTQTATLKADGNDDKKIAIITISETPEAVSEDQIAITIPKESIADASEDLTINPSDSAKFEILSEVAVPTAKNLTYNGQEQTAFETNDAYTLSEVYKATNVSENNYQATITLNKGYRWNTADKKDEVKTINWNIKKKTPDASDFTFTPPSGELKYVKDQAKTATVVFNNNKYKDNNDILTVAYYVGDEEKQSATDAATYTVKVNVAENGNFEVKNGVTGTEGSPWTFEITKAEQAAPNDVVGEAPSAADGKGKLKNLQAKMEYRVSTANEVDAWTKCPTDATEVEVEPATYYVRYQEDNNYSASPTATVTVPNFTSQPELPDVDANIMNAIGGYNGEYDGNTHDAVTDIPTEDGYTVEYKVSGETFTNVMPKVKDVADTTEIIVKVSKAGCADTTKQVNASVTEKNIAGAEITLGEKPEYNGTAQTIEITGVKVGNLTLTTADYGVTGNTATNVESTTLTLTGKGNFKGTATAVWSLQKKTPTAADFDLPKTGEYAYSGSAVVLSQLKAKDGITGMGNTTTHIKNTEGNDATPKNVGTYTVTFDVADGKNYSAATGLEIGTITITAKQLTIAANAANRAYEAGNKEVDVTLTLDTTGVITDDEVALAATTVKGTMADANVGTGKAVTVTATPKLTGTAAGNYTLATIPAVTVNITAIDYTGEKAHTEKANAGAQVSCDLAKDFTLPEGCKFGEIVVTDADSILEAGTKIVEGKLNFAIKSGAAVGKKATIKIPVTSTNYNNFDIVITAEVTQKSSSSGGGSYYPYTPSTPSKPAAPNLDKTKTDSTTAINAAATANKYDAAEQAEVKKILDKANADIKNAKTEAEVKAIEEAAQAEIDKILTTEEKATVAALDNVEKRDFETKSKVITRKGGKKVIRLTWTAPDGVDVDGYEIFRSTKKNSGFGTKPYFETTNTSYTNTKNLKPGKIYYYKVRAFVVINGERVYTDYSMKAFRTIK